MAKQFLMVIVLLAGSVYCPAQDSSLVKFLEDSAGQAPPEVIAGTFKATQIINMPTVEAPAKKSLQFMIMHRFGRINEGAYELFGLDNASIRFALDYGLTDNFSIGVGRSSFEKVYDASLKWKIIRQKAKGMPVTVSLYALMANTRLKYADKSYLDYRYRTMYNTQLLIARKFSRNLSLQLSPSLTHFNLVPTPADENDVIAFSFGGRLKVTRRMSINAEYNYLPSGQVASTKVYNAASLGIDLETGGHVFQLVFTNAQGMVAPYYLAKTTGSWGKGDIYFGFNITRIFNRKK